MYEQELTALAADLGRAREGKTSRGTKRRRIVYSPQQVSRALALLERTKLSPSDFASRVGVSVSALGRWVRASARDAGVLMPVLVSDESRGALNIEARAPAPTSGDGSSAGGARVERDDVVVRTMVISFPAGMPAERMRDVATALLGGRTC
jgi:transposase-like protein